MRKRALLISLMDWDSLIELPAVITHGGYSLDIYAKHGSWVLQNSFYQKHLPASTDTTTFVEELIAMVTAEPDTYDWIIPGDDAIIRLLNDRLHDETLFYKMMPLTKIANRTLLGSKAGFSELCTHYKISTPKYEVYKEGMSVSHIIDSVGFPMMVKVDRSEGGYGVYLCRNENELQVAVNGIADKTNLVFQQFIEGYEINTEVLFRKGILLAYSYSRRLKCFGKFGASTQRLYYKNADIAQDLIRIGSEFGLSGFGNVVFMYSVQEQKHYLIEVDMRPNSWVYYGKLTGNDFSKAISNIAAEKLETTKPHAENENKEITISLYKKDIYRCLTEKDMKGLTGWLMNKSNCWQYIPRYDKVLHKACRGFLRQTATDMVKNKLGIGRKANFS